MKLIAHRGASLERPENSLESLIYGSELGAYAVECDVHMTSDGEYVIFHDNNLARLGGDPRKVHEVTLNEMRYLLAAKGNSLLTLDDLMNNYSEGAFVLLHIKLSDPDETFFRMLYDSKVRFICGVQSVKTAKVCRRVFPSERILAFMPEINMYVDFFNAGAGIIRLWENWLDRVTPDVVRSACPGTEVFIMANRPGTGMNGTPETLENLTCIGADGVLLNDIRMAVDYFNK
jgi:hypothetical protein